MLTFKQTAIGEVPENWNIIRLDELASVKRGKFSIRPRNDPRFYGGSVPFVQTGDVVAANGHLRTHHQTLNENGLAVSKLFPAPTILLTIAANIGDTAITTYPVCCPDSVVGIQPNATIDVRWLREALASRKNELNQKATQNAQKNINLQHLKPLLVPTPPSEEQAAIGLRAETFDRTLMAMSETLEALRHSKRSLICDLLTGKKRVSTDILMAAE